VSPLSTAAPPHNHQDESALIELSPIHTKPDTDLTLAAAHEDSDVLGVGWLPCVLTVAASEAASVDERAPQRAKSASVGASVSVHVNAESGASVLLQPPLVASPPAGIKLALRRHFRLHAGRTVTAAALSTSGYNRAQLAATVTLTLHRDPQDALPQPYGNANAPASLELHFANDDDAVILHAAINRVLDLDL
jgi:hypothetical protein